MEDGWVAVDHTTLATKFENVDAVGDVTSAPVPGWDVDANGPGIKVPGPFVNHVFLLLSARDAPTGVPGIPQLAVSG